MVARAGSPNGPDLGKDAPNGGFDFPGPGIDDQPPVISPPFQLELLIWLLLEQVVGIPERYIGLT